MPDPERSVKSVYQIARIEGEMSEPVQPGRRYGGKSIEERRAERREKLLDAGLELFGTAGYGSTTIEMLCAATRLNPRYFYEAFQTREALLEAVYDRHVGRVLAEVRAAISSAPADPRERLETGLRAFVSGVLADQREARVNYFEVVGVSRALEERRRQVLRTYADLIASQFEQSTELDRPPGGDRRLAAVALVSATDGLITDSLSNSAPTDPEQIIMTLLEIFLPS